MRDTLELKILRMPAQIDGSQLKNLQETLGQWLLPQAGVMLDFSATQNADHAIAHILLLAQDLACARQASLSWMGESPEIAQMLTAVGLVKSDTVQCDQAPMFAPRLPQESIQLKIA
jgi:anti-anti-sigma regulatory factor